MSARRTTAAALASLRIASITGVASITSVAGIAGVAGSARADGPPADSGVERAAELAPGAIPDLAALGVELTPRAFATPSERTRVELHGYLRIREAALVNLDLDRGLDPSGQPLYPVPLAGGQVLDGGDLRARTDLAIYPRGTGVAIKARIDLLDNLAWGGTPEVGTGRSPTPAASAGQAAHTAIAIKRAWGEVLTPLGIFAAGRMGAHWGLGMAANGGDCEECDGGDAADRIALVTPLAGHFLALAWDLTSSGPFRRRAASDRPIDLEPSDDVTTVTAAWLRTASPATRLRRAAAGRPTFEYGVFASHRWQDRDVPADYLPVAGATPTIDAAQLMARGFSATSFGGWARITSARMRLEVEGSYAHARIEQPSLIPGVLLDQAATSDQFGLAFESDVALGRHRAGLDAGVASGDDAPGFGAFPVPGAAAARPGDLDGPQADPPGDTTVDNFRFHPDYHVDRILFRELIGTVTDAAYVRPHAAVTLGDLGHARLRLTLAVIASWAMAPTSTPSGARHLGVEVDPSLVYHSDSFRLALDYAALAPGAAFDHPTTGATARAAQLVRLRLGFHY